MSRTSGGKLGQDWDVVRMNGDAERRGGVWGAAFSLDATKRNILQGV